jgi:D-glycero-D-manno-heptose 1,7-bisphosphate phosphatase
VAVKPAVFIDKDGTLVHDVPYNVDPERLELRADAGRALRALQEAGYALILVTNQAGVALGRFPESALPPLWSAIAGQLEEEGVELTAVYYCPHHPAGAGAYAQHCDCRKPQDGLLRRAALAHDIDLARSWMIGDILDDVEAGHRAGCRSVLLDVQSETEWQLTPMRTPDYIAPDLTTASRLIAEQA